MVRTTMVLPNIKKMMSLLKPQVNNGNLDNKKSELAAVKSPYPSAQVPTRHAVPKSLENMQTGFQPPSPIPSTSGINPLKAIGIRSKPFTHGCGTPNSASQYVFNKPPSTKNEPGVMPGNSQYAFGNTGNSGSIAAHQQRAAGSATYVSSYRADFARMQNGRHANTSFIENPYAELSQDRGAEPQLQSMGSSYNSQAMRFGQPVHQEPKPADRPTVAQLRKAYQSEIEVIQGEGLLKTERVITAAQNPRITFKGNQLRILNFCANNYLGFASNTAVLKYSRNILLQYGSGLSSVRHICGTQDIHKDLEKLLSKFHGREDAMLYNSGYAANIGIFDALLSAEDAVFIDECSHVSLKHGAKISQATEQFYKHLDMADLANMLESSKARRKLIATDGVFSMDGDTAPLPQILDLADQHDAIVLLDESQATGIFGSSGRGSEEYHNCLGRVDILNSSLSKALSGAAGGYTVGPAEFIALLRQKSDPYLCSNSLSPAVVAAAHLSLHMLMASGELLNKLRENTLQFRTGMKEAGFQVLGDEHPLCPVIVGDTLVTNTFADKIQWRGVYVMPITYPLVPKDKPRLRVQISAAHTSEEIKKAIDAFVFIGRMLKVIC